jgi:hypothetical protein
MNKRAKRRGKERIRERAARGLDILKKRQPALADKIRVVYKDGEELCTATAVDDIPAAGVILGIVFTDAPKVGTPGYYFYE